MIKIIFLVLFIIGVLISVGVFIQIQNSKNSSTPFNTSTSNTATNSKNTLSKLSVSGNLIINEEGKTIRLRGVNFEDPFFLEKGTDENGVVDNHFPKLSVDFARVKTLGVNVVRLPIYPGYYFLVGGD